MKIKAEVIRRFTFRLSEEEFAVLMDALFEHSNNGSISKAGREVADEMRNQLSAAIQSTFNK